MTYNPPNSKIKTNQKNTRVLRDGWLHEAFGFMGSLMLLLQHQEV